MVNSWLNCMFQKSHGRDRPRVWWCTKGRLVFLPIHAAGVYARTERDSSDASDGCASDFMVSSYTPSILSLVRAKSSVVSLSQNTIKGLAVHEGSPMRGWQNITKVKNEVDRVKQCFEQAGATITIFNDNNARPTVSGVLTCLQDSDVNILHLSCHGVQKTDPLASTFIMHDGDLTIQELMKLDLKQAIGRVTMARGPRY
jgi:hypothetical protein